MARNNDMPLSVRLDPHVWNWLNAEADRRTRLTGVPIGPSSIVRAIVEHAAQAESQRESISDFRKRLKIESLRFTPEFFDALRDRTPEPEVRL